MVKTCGVDDCTTQAVAKGLCKKHYARLRRHGHTDPTRISGSVEDHYTPGQPGECWLWTGSINTYGYGRYGNPARMAHRIVYEQKRGPITDGLVLDHLCRTPACVNPAHLEPVPQGLNIERGLLGYPIRTMCRNGLHDVTHPSARYVNTYGKQTCLECKRANDRRAEAKRGQRTR